LRIASIHSALAERGGAERSILEQAHYLMRNHEVTVFGTYVNKSRCYEDLMKGLDVRQLVGIPVSKLDLFINTSLGLLLARKFKRDLKGYDVLLSHQEPAHWIAFCSKRPYVVQIHSLLTALYPELGDLPWGSDYDRMIIDTTLMMGGRRFARWSDQQAVRGAESVLVQGKMTGRMVQDIYGVRPVQVPYAIDFSRYLSADPKPVFARYSIRHPLILMVTRPVPGKRPDLMIRILPKILKDYPTATLVIACAEGLYTHIWRKLAESLGVATSTKIISISPVEINALYSGASVVVYPTQAPEMLGRVVVEAMYFGVPPVVWDNEWGPAEAVKDGVGLRARPYDINDFLDKILALLGDDELRQRMGNEAKRYARMTFSWEKAGHALEEILESVNR